MGSENLHHRRKQRKIKSLQRTSVAREPYGVVLIAPSSLNLASWTKHRYKIQQMRHIVQETPRPVVVEMNAW
jgi:hypothetical protein